MTEPKTLPGALAAEIARVAAIRQQYRELQRMALPNADMRPVIGLMSLSLDAAIAAAGTPDIVRQAQALQELRGYNG